MDKSQDYEIDYAFMDVAKMRHYINYPDTFTPLKYPTPVGAYSIDPDAVYAGRTYTFGIRLDNIDLRGKFNVYQMISSRGRIIGNPRYDPSTDLVLFTLAIPPSTIPKLDVTTIPGSLWEEIVIRLTINGRLVRNSIKLPIAFSVNEATPTGDKVYNSDKAFFTVNPKENMNITLISASGGGAGVNFAKGGTSTSGNEGGDATLCYLDPLTAEVRPIVFLEGGKGGRLSSHAHQNFKERTAQTKVFCNGLVTHSSTSAVYMYVSVDPHRNPSNELDNTSGGEGFRTIHPDLRSSGGRGGYKADLGYRGEGGMSGARAHITISHATGCYSQLPGPFIVLHPKTMVNAHKVIKDTDLKIKKTKTPMLAGEGGESISSPGGNGDNGTMIIGVL